MNKVWVMLFAGIVTLSCALAGFSGVPAHAAGSSDKAFISASNTFYVYARGGEVIDASFLRSQYEDEGGLPFHDITVTIEGPDLEGKTCKIAKDAAVGQGCQLKDIAAPKTGIYRVTFALPDAASTYKEVSPSVRWGGHLYSWKIIVRDGAIEKQGRIWSELYAIRQPQRPEFLEDFTFYYVSQSGYTYKGTYKGYNGQISTLSADGIGNRKNGDCEPIYRSIEVNDTKMSPAFGACGGGYKLFFEQPAGDLPQTALRWDGKTDWVSPAVARPEVSELRFTPDVSADGLQKGTISFKLRHFVGSYKIKIDTNNDGSFDQPGDVTIKRTLKQFDDTTQKVAFSGVDSQGQIVASTQTIGIQVVVEKVAEIHLIDSDVEAVAGGRELVRMNGDNAPTFRMCWDDSSLPRLNDGALETKVIDGRACPDSTNGVHGWKYATGSWGDGRYIDDWAFAEAQVLGTTKISFVPSEGASGFGRGGSSLPVLVAVIAGSVLLIFFVGFMIATVHKNKRQKQLADAEERARLAARPPQGGSSLPYVPPATPSAQPDSSSNPWQPRQ